MYEKEILEKLNALERRLAKFEYQDKSSGGSGGVTDHGALSGLGDDDHTQYLNNSRGDARYLGKTAKASDSDKLDGIDSTGFATSSHNHTGVYLPITGKASDSDKLDGIDSTGFVKTTGNQNVGGTKTFDSFPITPSSAPTSNYQVANKKYVDDKIPAMGIWQDWTPSNYAGWSSIPAGTYRYTIVGNTCFGIIDMTGGTSNSAEAKISLPPVSKRLGVSYGGVNGVAINNGVILNIPTRWYIGPNSGDTMIQFQAGMGTEGWHGSGVKRIRCNFFFEINALS